MQERKGVSSKQTLTVRHTCQRPCHVLQTALPLLRGNVHLPDIVDVKQAASHCNNEGVVHEVEGVDALWSFMRALLVRLGSGIPESDGAVPRAGDKDIWTQHFIMRKGNAVDVRHTVCLGERHRGDTVVVSPEVGHSFCGEIESATGS